VAPGTAVAVMGTGYALLMAFLAAGLRIRARGRPAAPPRRWGWPGLIARVAGTAAGGYLLLMAVTVAYYRGVARLPGGFLRDAATGCGLLVVLTQPAFLAVSWLLVRLRGRR
jgi:hypothetical protein